MRIVTGKTQSGDITTLKIGLDTTLLQGMEQTIQMFRIPIRSPDPKDQENSTSTAGKTSILQTRELPPQLLLEDIPIPNMRVILSIDIDTDKTAVLQ